MKNIYLPLIIEYDIEEQYDDEQTMIDWRKGCYFNRCENYTPEYQKITMTLRCNTFKRVIQFLYIIHCKNFTVTKDDLI
jgi:hypothetical protein